MTMKAGTQEIAYTEPKQGGALVPPATAKRPAKTARKGK